MECDGLRAACTGKKLGLFASPRGKHRAIVQSAATSTTTEPATAPSIVLSVRKRAASRPVMPPPVEERS